MILNALYENGILKELYGNNRYNIDSFSIKEVEFYNVDSINKNNLNNFYEISIAHSDEDDFCIFNIIKNDYSKKWDSLCLLYDYIEDSKRLKLDGLVSHLETLDFKKYII